MAVLVELCNTGDPGIGAEVQALVEHALSDRAGRLAGVDRRFSGKRRLGLEGLGTEGD